MDTNTLPASPKEKVDYVSGRLDDSIRSFQSATTWYRHVYFYTSMATLLLSGAITVIAGWKLETHAGVNTNNVVLILAALITVASGWGMFYSPKDSWLIYASSLNQLRALKMKMEFMKTNPSAFEQDEKLPYGLYEELQAIFDAHNKAWLELRVTTGRSRT
ncbi:MAG: SLATT domain-containing protein [Terriglobia bacterium]|jgi:hypothetical protein